MIIHCDIYGGVRCGAERDEIDCNNSENCPLYKQGKCILVDRNGIWKCAYGKKNTIGSTIRKSKKSDELIKKTRKDETYNKLKSVEDYFVRIGDYFYINVGYADIWHNKQNNTYSLESSYIGYREKTWINYGNHCFVLKENLTIDFLKQVLNFRPRAFLGGEIKDYQKNIVPQIKLGILKYAPELAKQLKIEKVDYIGMMGRLVTLKPNIHIHIKSSYNSVECFWDGEFIYTSEPKIIDTLWTSKSYVCCIGECVEMNAKFKPNENTWVTIEDNNWVLENSELRREK